MWGWFRRQKSQPLGIRRVGNCLMVNRFLSVDEAQAMQMGWELGSEHLPMLTNGLQGPSWPPMPYPIPPPPMPSHIGEGWTSNCDVGGDIPGAGAA